MDISLSGLFSCVLVSGLIAFFAGVGMTSDAKDRSLERSITTGAMIHDGKLYVIQQIGGR